MSGQATTAPDRMLVGDTGGSLNKEIAIGDIAIIEGWPLAEMMQLFPNSPDIQRDWSRKSQLFSLSDLNAEGLTRILKTLIVENPDATNDVDLSNLYGYHHLSKGLQQFVAAHVKKVLKNGTLTNYVLVPPGAGASAIALLARLRHGPALPEPRRLPRKLTETALRRLFQDTVHATAADFPNGWELPTTAALEAAVGKARSRGYAFADEREAATLPAHVDEIIGGAPTP